MILEQAILDVRLGEAAVFEAAVHEALPLIAASDSFLGLEVRPRAPIGLASSRRATSSRVEPLTDRLWRRLPRVQRFPPAEAVLTWVDPGDIAVTRVCPGTPN